MKQKLHQHINKFIPLDETQYEQISPYFKLLQVEKKDILTSAHEKCNKLYFVIEGLLHSFFIDDLGLEKTLQFALEGWWITDFLAFHHQRATELSLQAVEASTVLCITYDRLEELLSKHPEMERYFRKVYEIAYGATIMRVKMIYQYSKEDIFFRFRDQYPEFVRRAPQYMIATFLGLTPEYLSKLRSKKLS